MIAFELSSPNTHLMILVYPESNMSKFMTSVNRGISFFLLVERHAINTKSHVL